MKIKIKESQLVNTIINLITEEFTLNTAEDKLEFLTKRLLDLKNNLETGMYNVEYAIERINSILKISNNINESKKKSKFNKVMGEFGKGTLKTSAGDKVTDRKQAIAIAYSESGLDETILKEWKPNVGYDEWANLETGGAHSRGIQHRKNFTRKENSKYEKISDLRSPSDFIKLIKQWGEEGYVETERIYKSIIRKYKKNEFTLGDVHKISEFQPIQNAPVVQLLKDFVDEENKVVNFYPQNFREIDKTKPITQQPK